MTMTSERIPDELLSAWVDGELDAVTREQVAAWLQQHPDDAARVQQWLSDREALRDRFALPAGEPVPPRLHAAALQVARTPRWAMAAAAAGLLVAGALAGGAGVWQWQQRQMASL